MSESRRELTEEDARARSWEAFRPTHAPGDAHLPSEYWTNGWDSCHEFYAERVVPVSSEPTIRTYRTTRTITLDGSEPLDQSMIERLVADGSLIEDTPAPARPVVEASGEREAMEAAAEEARRTGNACRSSFAEGWQGRGAWASTRAIDEMPKRYLAWLCEGCDLCEPPTGEREATPCTHGSPSTSGAWVVRASDYEALAASTRVPDEAGQADASDRMYSAAEVEAIIEAAHGHGEKAGADRAEGALDENEVDAFPLTIQAAVREAEELLMRPIGAASRVPRRA